MVSSVLSCEQRGPVVSLTTFTIMADSSAPNEKPQDASPTPETAKSVTTQPLAESSSPSAAPTSSAPAPVVKPKAAPKKFVVKTTGVNLWKKMIDKANGPPVPYPKMTIPFSLTIPELLGVICSYADGDDIVRLYLTGNRELQQRLPLALESFNFRRMLPQPTVGNKLIRHWPYQLLPLFNRIRTFSIEYPHFYKHKKHFMIDSYFPVFEVEALPRHLSALTIECDIKADSAPFLQQFELLESLVIGPPAAQSGRPYHFPLEHLPPNLTTLRSNQFTTFGNIPNPEREMPETFREPYRTKFANLRSIFLVGIQYFHVASFFAVLPPTLEILHLNDMTADPNAIALLPRGLQVLGTTLNEKAGIRPHLLALPPKLTTLKIYNPPLTNLESSDLALLPHSLKTLRLATPIQVWQNNFSKETWPLPELTSLKLIGTCFDFPFYILPPSITKLCLPGSLDQTVFDFLPNIVYLDFPVAVVPVSVMWKITCHPKAKNLKTLKLPATNDISSLTLQPLVNLTYLKLGVSWSDPDLRNLPRSLRKLSLRRTTAITDAGTKDLPRSLRQLFLAENSVMTYAAYPNLPRSLECLIFAPMWYDNGGRDGLRTIKQDWMAHQAVIAEKKRQAMEQLDKI